MPNHDVRLGLPSASGLHIDVACAGRQNLKRAMMARGNGHLLGRDPEDDEQAARGDRLHRAFETGSTLELLEDEIEDYKIGHRFFEDIVSNWQRDKGIEACAEGERELRLWIHHRVRPIASAQLDRHWLAPPFALVVDLKTGWNPLLPVSARSWQLRLQALCLWKENPNIKEIRVAYCKSKSKYGANDVCDYTEEDLRIAEESILFHLRECEDGDAPRHAGPHCRYCECKAHCIEAGAYAMLVPKVVYDGVPANTDDVDEMVARLNPPQLVRLWESDSVVRKILEAVKIRLKAMPKSELAALGLELDNGRAMNTIANTKEAFEFLRNEEMFAEDGMWGCLKFGKGDLAKLAKTERGLSSEKAANKWLDETLDAFIDRGRSEGSLKRI